MHKSFTVHNLSKIYYENEIAVFGLNNISLEIKNNAFTLIMGHSGSGKSTLLHLLGGLDKPTSGFIKTKEYTIDSNTTDSLLAEYRHKNIGFIFQSFHLLKNMSVSNNITFPLQLAGASRINREQVVQEIIDKVGLSKKILNQSVNKLSGGEKQRVAIARSLVNNPNVILADEPTGNLDTKTGKRIIELLLDLCRENKTVIMVTHDERFKEIATQVFYMEDGKLINQS